MRRRDAVASAASPAMPMSTNDLFERYHRLLRDLSSRGSSCTAWRFDLGRILEQFDADCRQLPAAHRRALRRELSVQLEQEVLRQADAGRAAVLSIALKHLDAE